MLPGGSGRIVAAAARHAHTLRYGHHGEFFKDPLIDEFGEYPVGSNAH